MKSKNKLGFIDGTITKLESKGKEVTDEERAWEMANSMVISLIMNVIEPRLHKSGVDIDTAFKLW